MQSLTDGHSLTTGMLILAKALYERMSKVENLHAAHTFLEELLPPLLGASQVEVDLSLYPCQRRERNIVSRLEGEGVVVRHLYLDGMRIGEMWIRHDQDRQAMHPIDEAFVDLAGSYLSRMVMDAMKSDFNKMLTKTELKVLRVIDSPMDDILNVLQIENETLRSHKKNIYRKLGIKSSGEAALIASRLRFLDP